MGGLPAIGLYGTLVLCWLRVACTDLSPARDPGRRMLAITCFLVFWPIQSSSSFLTQPTAGWLFMAVGWALAASPVTNRLQRVGAGG